MKVRITVYKANKGNKKAERLARSQKHVVINEVYEVSNGNEVYKRLWAEHPEIKSNWEIKAVAFGR